jgi:cytoskeletal protein RodZ
METLGEYLKRERECRDISLEEISRKTKIREDLLTGLEEDRLDSSVSSVFIKGFLRAYARYVGLDPGEVMLRYETTVEGEGQVSAERARTKGRKQRLLRYIVLPVSALIVVGGILFALFQRPGTLQKETPDQHSVKPLDGRPPEVESPLAEEKSPPEETPVPTPGPEGTEALPPPSRPTQPTAPPNPEPLAGIEIELRAVEDTWLRIQIDGEPPAEVLLKKGQTLSQVGEQEIRMTVGNAGGLEIVHNGKTVGELGQLGKVVHLSIGPMEVKVE